jgi:hypothetical protein
VEKFFVYPDARGHHQNLDTLHLWLGVRGELEFNAKLAERISLSPKT